MGKAFVLEGVEFSWRPDRWPPCLGPLELEVEEGEFLAVMGPNGSGKTTLALLLNALLRPTRGRVISFGMDTRDPACANEIRREVGMIMQKPDHQIIGPTVEDDVAFGLENLGIPRERMLVEVERALAALRLEDVREREPQRLSSGQRQRLALAGVLAVSPRAIVSDESTALLDPAGREEVMAILRRLNRAEGMTLVHVTHRLEEAAGADRVLVLREGRPLLLAPPRDLFRDLSLLEELGMEPPPLLRLMLSLQGRGALPEDCCCGAEEMARKLCP